MKHKQQQQQQQSLLNQTVNIFGTSRYYFGNEHNPVPKFDIGVHHDPHGLLKV